MILNDASIGKVFVLKKEGHIIGMVSLLFTINTALGGKHKQKDMIIDTPFQGKGYGKILLKEVLKKQKNLHVNMFPSISCCSNLRAQKVYEGLGFEYSTMKVMLCCFMHSLCKWFILQLHLNPNTVTLRGIFKG